MKTLDYLQLNASATDNVVKSLQQLLADFQVYYTNLRGFHWNIQGPDFFVLHSKFEDLYNDAAEKIGISLHVFAQNEKRRLGVVLLQHRQNPLRDARCGAVVEGQENPLRVVDLPDQRREQVTDYFGRLEFHDEKKYSGGVRHRQR